jgi:hypothetical protein
MNYTHNLSRFALAALATLLVLGSLVILIPHSAHAQTTTQLFGYGGGGRHLPPLPPRLAEFLQNLFSRIFGRGGFPF